MTPHDVYVGAKLACLEDASLGHDLLPRYVHAPAGDRQGCPKRWGLRAHLSYRSSTKAAPSVPHWTASAAANMERFGEFSDRITFTLGPHAIYTVSGEQLQFCHQFAVGHGVKIHLHL